MLKHFFFGAENKDNIKVALLIKNSAMKKHLLEQYYIEPLKQMGISSDQIVAFSLSYTANNKAPQTLVKQHLAMLEKALSVFNIKYLFVADTTYFKTLAKVRKAEPYYGYSVPSIWPDIQAVLTLNYAALFYNPDQKYKLELGLKALHRELKGNLSALFEPVLQSATLAKGPDEIKNWLQKLHQYPALTCDIETTSLDLNKARLLTVAFAWNKHEGVAMDLRNSALYPALRAFLETYSGQLIFHNAPFDTKILIWHLWMESSRDIAGMLKGLHCMYRNVEDTRILTYLATNTTAGNHLSLKEQAFEFVGNYALDEISNPEKVPLDDLLYYNLTDCAATWYVYEKHRQTVRDIQESVYQEIFKPALKVVTQMELSGMPMDLEQVKKTEEELQQIKAQFLDQIRQSPFIKDFEEIYRCLMAIEATAKLKQKIKFADDFEDFQFNPGSPKQLQLLLYEFLDLPVLSLTATGQPSTDGKTLTKLKTLLSQYYGLDINK